jgi:hypothetical protein
MTFNGLRLRFIRFLGPQKPQTEFVFAPGVNILWGASDTGKTFLVEAIDFMLGASEGLKDIPERQGYDRVLLGISTTSGKDYTLQRSANGGNFLRFDGLLIDPPANGKGATRLNAAHNAKNYTNLSHWLLQEIGLDNKKILYSKDSGETRSLGFRALAHLCVITAKNISKSTSPIESGQYTEKTRDYGVFKLLLTGLDDSAVVPDVQLPPQPVARVAFQQEALEQMLATYENELANLTDQPDSLETEEFQVEEDLEKLQVSLRNMESQLAETTRLRKEAFARFSSRTSRRDEIAELQARFRLLDAQYSSDLKRLLAIEESGQFFVLIGATPCPVCGASPENQRHDSVCDGNVAAVTQAASAEIAKIQLLQSELRETVTALSKENIGIKAECEILEVELRKFQQKIDAALSPEFAEARKTHAELIEKRAAVRTAAGVYRRVVDTRKKISQNAIAPFKPELVEETPVTQYMPKAALDAFAKLAEKLLQAWHFPNATNVYFDEAKRDLVIGGRPRGSRGSGLCAITHSAFTIALLDFCRTHKMPHPGFVILDSPLLAFKEPQGEDENIAGTDLKPRFYEHLIEFVGDQQLFIVENTDPPANILARVHGEDFTGNPNMGRFGLFPTLKKEQ